jgi:hypothetical protein
MNRLHPVIADTKADYGLAARTSVFRFRRLQKYDYTTACALPTGTKGA